MCHRKLHYFASIPKFPPLLLSNIDISPCFLVNKVPTQKNISIFSDDGFLGDATLFLVVFDLPRFV